jgi:hypothetical protein
MSLATRSTTGLINMAKRKRGRPRTDRDDVTTKIDREVYNKAFAVARARKVPVAELLSEVLEAPINRLFEQEMRRAAEKGGES